MNNPRYSILYCGHVLQSFIEEIDSLLKEGVKVIWFGKENDLTELEKRFPKPFSVRLLQVYRADNNTKMRIVDGDITKYESDFSKLSAEVKSFNSEQYLVEHSGHRGIIVTASAGTGKTSVMVDRVLYLLHMGVKDPSRITMITFTNNATEQMMSRLQSAIIGRYVVTGNRRYILMLEQASQIQISTIDSFAYRILRNMGTSIGYSHGLEISSDALELKSFTRDYLDSRYVEGKRVRDCFGVNMHEVFTLIRDFRNRLASLGVDMTTVDKMDWGEGTTEESQQLQRVLRDSYNSIEIMMEKDRLRRNAVPLYVLSQELNRALSACGNEVPDLGLDHLFVDEFQDTSDDQIRMVVDLSDKCGSTLFVVGDPKQSIYRFRGADDSAFRTLEFRLNNIREFDVAFYSLVNNYRTCPEVLNKLDRAFRKWVNAGFLTDFDRLVPCSNEEGGMVLTRKVNTNTRRTSLPKDIRELLSEIKQKDSKYGSSGRKIAILVRANWQVEEVADICEKSGIPITLRRDLPLFLSTAVRDLYSLLSSYLHPGDSVSIFEYLCTPYSGRHEPINMEKLLSFNGSKVLIQDYLYEIQSSTDWQIYRDRFKMEPALSVLREILDNTPVIENHIALMKREGCDDLKVLEKDARRYRRNLEKVMEILHRMFPQDGLDLSHICEFLEVSISTNREEMEPELELGEDDKVCCMTVHKAKGLEFDTVIVPFGKVVKDGKNSEILISEDKSSIGWQYVKESDDDSLCFSNSNYNMLHNQDLGRIYSEETRILYVALTRAKRNLLVYTSYQDDDSYSWSNLLGAL